VHLINILIQKLGPVLRDLAPIMGAILFFQRVVLRRELTHVPQLVLGLMAVLVGLWMLLLGLDMSLFPLGQELARQLVAAVGSSDRVAGWHELWKIGLLAFGLGFSATVAEPALLAVALKAEEISGGTIRATPLRIAVALGSGTGVLLGAVRIATGVPLMVFIVAGYGLVIVQTLRAPPQIVALAYDAGGVTTSTITVPLVAALGVGLAEQFGRPVLAAGFGMIALAVLFPMVTVMGYAQLARWWASRGRRTS